MLSNFSPITPESPFGAVDPGPIIAWVFDYWCAMADRLGRIPGRQHVDPLAIAAENPEALPHLWLLDVERNPYRFRCRLVGGALKRAGAVHRVGDYLDTLVDHSRPNNLQQRLIAVCERHMPDFRGGPPQLPHDRYVAEVHRLSLPLARDGTTVDMILNVSDYVWMR